MTLTPLALRHRRLLIQHTCQAITELHRQGRLDELDDAQLQRCCWCGSWTDGRDAGVPSCQRCTPPPNTSKEPPR